MASKPIPARLLLNPVHLLSLGFGSGLSPVAPGTMGTLVALPIFWFLAHLQLWPYLLIVLIFAVVGVYLCGRTADALGVHDHGGIVWDEIVGYLITMMTVPPTGLWIVTGFVLFRIFDILKPWPIRLADTQIEGGLGIMLDDILAGIYAWIVLQFVIYLAQ